MNFDAVARGVGGHHKAAEETNANPKGPGRLDVFASYMKKYSLRNKTVELAASVTFVVVVFSLFTALDVSSIYVGGSVLNDNACVRPIAAWSVVRGVAGLISTALIIASIFSRGTWRGEEEGEGGDARAGSRLAGRSATQRRAIVGSLEDKELLAGALGLFELFNAIWFVVGLAFVVRVRAADQPDADCPQGLVYFVFVYVVCVWVAFALVLIVSFGCIGSPLLKTTRVVGGDVGAEVASRDDDAYAQSANV